MEALNKKYRQQTAERIVPISSPLDSQGECENQGNDGVRA